MTTDGNAGSGDTRHPRPEQRDTPPGRGPVLASVGDLEVRVSTDPADIAASQALRYEVFYLEMSAIPTSAMAAVGRDFDDYDEICDHLLVFDYAAPPREDGGVRIVGTYRMLRQEVALNSEHGFYTATEYDISPFLKKMREGGIRFVELGRSCTHADYRDGATIIELLWKGIMSYVTQHNIDVMFGCASFETTKPDDLAIALSYLYYECMAPEEWCVRALDDRYVQMDRVPPEKVTLRGALRGLPPLIKGYLRAGAWIGDGAVVDLQFGTTDVLIIFPVERINARYLSRYVVSPKEGE